MIYAAASASSARVAGSTMAGVACSSRSQRQYVRRSTPRRRANLTFRISDETRAALQREADAAKRSLSEEVERRLSQSLQEDRIEAKLALILARLPRGDE